MKNLNFLQIDLLLHYIRYTETDFIDHIRSFGYSEKEAKKEVTKIDNILEKQAEKLINKFIQKS